MGLYRAEEGYLLDDFLFGVLQVLVDKLAAHAQAHLDRLIGVL